MRILVVCNHYAVCSGRYITEAFQALGHDVRHIGEQKRLQDAWGVATDAKYEWTPDGSLFDHQDWQPDLVVVADSDPTILNDGKWYDYYNAPIVVWGVDNHVRAYRHPYFTHYFLAHNFTNTIGFAQPVTHPDETWLPCATSVEHFPPSQIAWADRKFDVALVGVLYPNRVRLLDAIEAAGFKVFRGTGLLYDEYAAAYHNSRVSLCVSAAGDVAQRIFETAGMGCMVLTDVLRDLDHWKTNKALGLSGFMVYQSQTDAAECVERVRDAIQREPGLAQHGAETMQAIVLARHTWKHRAQVVVDWYNREYGTNMKMVEAVNQHVDELPEEIAIGAEVNQNNHATGNVIIRNLATGVERIENYKTGDVKHPYLNLGCGKTHLPSAPPPGHETVDAALYSYPLWLNVDKVEGVGADKTFDLFAYPWPLEDNSYDGALLAHICEHIPHEITLNKKMRTIKRPASEEQERYVDKMFTTMKRDDPLRPNFGHYEVIEDGYSERAQELAKLQDGWYCFFSELYRVLTPGAVVHIVSPYGHSDSGITDPSHTRYLTDRSFTHSMQPEHDGATFQYNNGGINFEMVKPAQFRLMPSFDVLRKSFPQEMFPLLDPETIIRSFVNVVYDIYVQLKVVK